MYKYAIELENIPSLYASTFFHNGICYQTRIIVLVLVFFFQGSPYRQLDLYAVNVHLSNMCILLSPCQGVENVASEEEALCDKEVIMVTLTLKGEYSMVERWRDYSYNRLLHKSFVAKQFCWRLCTQMIRIFLGRVDEVKQSNDEAECFIVF